MDDITHIQSIIVVSSNIAANIRKSMSKSVRSSVTVPPRATNSPSLTLHCFYPKVTPISRCRDNGQAPFTSSALIPSSSSYCQSLHPGHHHAETAGVTRPTPALCDRSSSTTNTTVSGVEEQQETIAPVDEDLFWRSTVGDGMISRNLPKHCNVGEPSVFPDGDFL
jgi:hypothetical protein